MYVDKSGVKEVDITLFTTASTIRYLRNDSHKVDRDLEMNVHAPTMQFVGKGLQVVSSPKLVIELSSISDPVAMVGISIGCRRALIVL